MNNTALARVDLLHRLRYLPACSFPDMEKVDDPAPWVGPSDPAQLDLKPGGVGDLGKACR